MATVKVRIDGVKSEVNLDESMFFTVDEMNETLQTVRRKWPNARTTVSKNIHPLPDGRRVYLVNLTFESAPRYLADYRS